MEHLKEAIEALQRARDAKLAELEAIERALEELKVPVEAGSRRRSARRDFEHLGITEATRRYLTEEGEPRTTREIADALLDRGIRTRSKNYVATVYSTLTNASAFKRTPDARWVLADTA